MREALAVVGIALMAGAVVLFLVWVFSSSPLVATRSEPELTRSGGETTVPREETNDGESPASPNPDVTSPCISAELTLSEQRISENEDLSVSVTGTAPAHGEEGCSDEVSLRAPGFDIHPDSAQRVEVPASGGRGPKEAYWLLAPRKPGTYTVVAATSQGHLDSDNVVVTNAIGLSPGATLIFTVASWILGPMLTVPYWLERRRSPNGNGASEEPSGG